MSEAVEITRIIKNFAKCFDIKDWKGLRLILADQLTVDYSDLRGEPKRCIEADFYIEQRVNAHQKLKTTHLMQEPEITFSDLKAVVKVSCSITRSDGDKHFNTQAEYTFSLIKQLNKWVVNEIVQKVISNDGESSIHSGVR